MLSLRDLEEGTVKDTKEDCCDKDVTTCRDFTADEGSCGEGRMPLTNKDNFDTLIYEDEARESCCEDKKIEEPPPPKKKCCDRKAPLVHVRYFQSPLTTVLQPQQAVDSGINLRGALEKLAEEVNRYVGDDDSDDLVLGVQPPDRQNSYEES